MHPHGWTSPNPWTVVLPGLANLIIESSARPLPRELVLAVNSALNGFCALAIKVLFTAWLDSAQDSYSTLP